MNKKQRKFIEDCCKERKEVDHTKIVLTIMVIISLAAAYFMFFYFIIVPKDYPRLVIKAETFSEEEWNGTTLYEFGSYNKYNNLIWSSNQADIENTIIHEYNHWLFKHIINRKERNEWLEICNQTELLNYPKKQVCEERFVRGMTDYMELRRLRLEPNLLLEDQEIEFILKIYEKYY